MNGFRNLNTNCSKLYSDLYPDTITIDATQPIIGYVIHAAGIYVPITNIPLGYNANITSVEVYNGGWQKVTVNDYVSDYVGNIIRCTGLTVDTTSAGYPILCRMSATFTKR